MTRPGTIAVTVLLLGLGTAATVSGALQWSHALAGAVVVAVLVGLYRDTQTSHEDPQWPRLLEESRAGGRHEVSDLGWSMLGTDGRVKDRVVARVRRVAARRLRRAGRDASDLGVDLRGRPTFRGLARWLDAIERLPDTPSPDPAGSPGPADSPAGRPGHDIPEERDRRA